MTVTNLNPLGQWFWNEDIWLPPNVTWSDLEGSRGGVHYSKFTDLWYPIPAAFIIIAIRFIFEK